MRAGQKRGPDGQANGRCHAFMRILDEAIPTGAKTIIHAALRQRDTCHHFRPKTLRTQATRQLQTIMQQGANGAMPANGFIGAAFKQNQLPASSAKLCAFCLGPPATRQIANQQQIDHRHRECFTQSANDLAWHTGHHTKLLPRGMTTHRRRRITRKPHIGINEQEMCPLRCFRQTRAGMHLAGPTLRQRRARQQTHPRIPRGISIHNRRRAIG